MTGAALPKDPRFPEPQKFLERACLAVVTLIAAVELAAWLAPSLGDHLPQAWSLMKANTAVGMLLAVVCLALSSIQATAWRLHLTALFGGLMVLLGSVVILEHGLDTSSFLDTLLAADTGSPRPGLMSAQSAFSFVILGLVLPLSGATRGVASFVADFLTLILVCLVLTAVLGAVYGVVRLIGQSAETRVSLQTLLCFILLTYVLIGRRTVGDTFSVLRGGAIGSRIARVAVPLVIFLPVALSMVHHYASTRGRISDPGGDALLVSFLCLSVACLVMFMAWHANALERRLRQLLGEQARQQLQESEQRYADLVEQSVFGILVRTQDRRILLANDTFCRLSGYTREELLHETREAFTRRVDPVAVAQAEALRPGESVRLQSQLRRKDGTMVPIEVFTLRLLNGNLQSTVEDVSERIQAERAQAESEQRYIDLIEQSIFGIIVRTPGRRILLVNDAFCRIKGSSREELLRLPPEDYAQTFDPSAVARVETLKPGESMRYEAQMKRTDGTQVTVEVVTLRLLNGNLQSTLKDITEHKQAERARTESEKRYFELVEQAIEGILVRKAGGELIFVNDTLCRMLGYSREELLRMSIRDLVDPADAATIEQVQRLNAGELLHLEKRLRHKSGREVHVEVSTRRQLGGDFQTTVQDVTARKLAERRFYTMVEGAPNAMLMVDAQGDITLVNRQTEELFGYTRAELVGQSIERLVPPRFRAQHPGLRVGFQREPQMRAMGAGRDLYALRKDGTEIPVEIGLNPVETGEGRFVLASIIDITERREAELRDRIYTEELQLMSQRLLDAQETERRAIARELHDEVGQALTAARINLQELERQAGAGILAKQAGDTAGIIARLLQQVRQISLNLHPSVLDDLGLAPAIRWTLRERAGSSGIEIKLELQEDLPRFTALIEICLYRVFQEAVSNVLRHSQAKHLRVTLEHKGERLELCLADDGRGFEPAAAQKHAREGTSLGVMGMQERVRLAGGEIMIESVPGRGTLVRVSVPAIAR